MKKDNFIVSAFITISTPYEEILSKYLLPSLEKFNIPHYIEAIENQGSWLRNVTQKPRVILNAMEKFPHMNIVSLDVDCEILQFPQLFLEIPEEYDFACHTLDWDSWYGYTNHIKEILSGTCWIRNNDKMKELVTNWFSRATSSNEWEQKVLASVLKEMNIKVFELPIEYVWIDTLPDGSPPYVKPSGDIVIRHFQKSRQLKRQIH
jgi:hypothetical protein